MCAIKIAHISRVEGLVCIIKTRYYFGLDFVPHRRRGGVDFGIQGNKNLPRPLFKKEGSGAEGLKKGRRKAAFKKVDTEQINTLLL